MKKQEKQQILKNLAFSTAAALQVSIWDLDYYSCGDKAAFQDYSTLLMKISSYYKQQGAAINLVETLDDIKRPFDLMFIYSNKTSLSTIPINLLLNEKQVKICGDQSLHRKNHWTPDNVILACRPDYLLYPKYIENNRAERVQLMGIDFKPLAAIQDYYNTFKNKRIEISDKYLWCAETKDIIEAFNKFIDKSKHNSISFTNPIRLQRILKEDDLKNFFLSIPFTSKSLLQWEPIEIEECKNAFDFMEKLKKINPSLRIQTVEVFYSKKPENHWNQDNSEAAKNDFSLLQDAIVQAKKQKIHLYVIPPQLTTETPYFFIFKVLSEWSSRANWFKQSWLEWLTATYYGIRKGEDAINYWQHPEKWNNVFRDLLRQTYLKMDFLVIRWGDDSIDSHFIPIQIWKEEFKYEI